jgi:transcriptional regulator with GAF, ATPase, and Fis domain
VNRAFANVNSPLAGVSMDLTELTQTRAMLEEAPEEIKVLKAQLYRQNYAFTAIDQAPRFDEIIGSSVALKKVLVQIASVAPTDATTLILGETGTGKELIARAIHRRSSRFQGPFIRVNCAAIPNSLIASELFGYEKGAFTGALQRQLGRFELADGGTIFLDEVGELPPDTQVALLRVLQEREFERIGGARSVRVNVRVIAATNRDLKSATVDRTFRLDLFYRLNVFPIEMPALRERRSDILSLLEYFVKHYAKKMGKTIRSIDKETAKLFRTYDWPGNIRELQNVVERSVILSSGDVLFVDKSWLCEESCHPEPINREKSAERSIIEAALAESRGRVAGSSGAAAKLRIPRSTLQSRIKALEICTSEFKYR